MPVVTIVLTLLALLGHAALWVGFVNRAHAVGFSRVITKLLSGCGHMLLMLTPLLALGLWLSSGESLDAWLSQSAHAQLLWLYLIPCWILALAIVVLWVQRHWVTTPLAVVLEQRTRLVDVAALLGKKPLAGGRARLLAHVPGNQVLQLAVDEKQFVLERLPSQLEGFSITHLTDLHITGRIGVEFFQEVVQQANALRSDMIVLTGDILDKIELLGWIPQTLAPLSAPLGTYFVLGNHDEYTGAAPRIRQALTGVGFTDIGNQWRRLDVAGAEVILAGNEAPWFRPPPDMQRCPPRSSDRPQLRLLLAHSPDQWPWARRCDFDLMLAGHTHGGQIRLPLIGPIFAPSMHGVKYASGTFYANPTLMHVSRGISAELPLRINCRPELTKIVLQSK
ncbi:MAG TPA: metallophosphoesterase [Pirellulales bacterium]|nr:metallophosphoesterase [Pirellulales bacterium]